MTWLILAVIAAFLGTLASIMEKKVLNRIHVLEFSTELSFYGLILSFFLLPWVEWSFSPQIYLLILINGLLLSLAYYLMLKALHHSEISEISPLTNLITLSTLVFAVILLKDIPTLLHGLGVFFILIGTYVLELRPHQPLSTPFTAFRRSRALVYALLSIAIYGLVSALGKIILLTVPVISFVFFIWFTNFLGFLILDALYQHDNLLKFKEVIKKERRGTFLTTVAFFVYRIFMVWAFALGSVTLVQAISRTSTFFTALLGGRIFGERDSGRRALSAAIMILGVILIAT